MSTFQPVCKVSEIPDPGKILVELDDRILAVFHIEGHFYAIEDMCTHDRGSLAEGRLEGWTIQCPRHGATFDVRTGKVLSMPATEDVPTHEVKVENDTVYVKLRE